MPFRNHGNLGKFSALDIDILRTAYVRGCEHPGCDPAAPDARHEFAEHILRTFRTGERNPETIAAIACRMLS